MTADELRSRREALGLTKADLARLCGVRWETVRRWEAGQRRVPDVVDRIFTLLDEMEALRSRYKDLDTINSLIEKAAARRLKQTGA